MKKKKTIWEETEEKREILKKLYIEKEAQKEFKRILVKIRSLQILKLRENKNKKLSFAKIAKKYGISRQRVFQLYKEAVEIAKNNESAADGN